MLAPGANMIVLMLLILALAVFIVLRRLGDDEPSSTPFAGLFYLSLTLKLAALGLLVIAQTVIALPALVPFTVPISYILMLLSLCFVTDLHIIGRLNKENIGRALPLFVFLLLFIAGFDLNFRSELQALTPYDVGSIAIFMAFSSIFIYQITDIEALWSISHKDRSLLRVIGIILLICSLTGLGLSIAGDILPFLRDANSTDYIAYAFVVGAFIQSGIFWKSVRTKNRDSKEKSRQLDPEFKVWNAYGFINNVESARLICARLDQGVTLAVFKIDDYATIRQSLSAQEFKQFQKAVVDWLTFSLRKHDQFAILDENIFAILLPFTDIAKGEAACRRLNAQTQKEILLRNFLLPNGFGMRFGLTRVARKEPDVLAALERAAGALASVGDEIVKTA